MWNRDNFKFVRTYRIHRYNCLDEIAYDLPLTQWTRRRRLLVNRPWHNHTLPLTDLKRERRSFHWLPH